MNFEEVSEKLQVETRRDEVLGKDFEKPSDFRRVPREFFEADGKDRQVNEGDGRAPVRAWRSAEPNVPRKRND